ncbi:hypothetical protein [Tardisphaera saccharovorans]
MKAGVTSILIVTGKENAGAFLDLLGSGKDFGARFQFALQEEERMKSGGITRWDITYGRKRLVKESAEPSRVFAMKRKFGDDTTSRKLQTLTAEPVHRALV